MWPFLFPWFAVSPWGNHFPATSHLMTVTSFKTLFELRIHTYICKTSQVVMLLSSLLYFLRLYHRLSEAETAFQQLVCSIKALWPGRRLLILCSAVVEMIRQLAECWDLVKEICSQLRVQDKNNIVKYYSKKAPVLHSWSLQGNVAFPIIFII